MKITGLDFFSEPPQINYCKKETNQTFFGGVLFFIYIGFMIVITVIYTCDYFMNELYEIQYSLIKETDVDGAKLNKDEELNPYVNFKIELHKLAGEEKLSDRFMIFDFNMENNNTQQIERGTFIKRKANNLNFILVYNCTDEECALDGNDIDMLGYYLKMTYKGYKLDHQSPSIPLDINADKYFIEEYPFFFNSTFLRLSQWEVIKYKEERGIMGLFDDLFNIQNEYTAGYISSSQTYTLDHPLEIGGIGGKTKFIGIFGLENNHKQYTEYTRIKKSVLDVLANIGALFSTFFACFIFVYKYYSSNYNNYYLIDKILTSRKIQKYEEKNLKKKVKDIELGHVENEGNNIDSNKESPLISDVPDEKNLNIKDDDDNKKDDEDDYQNFKNLNFLDFILHNFSCCKCCQKGNKGEIIETCNDILSKYIYVDILLYNQIMIENLLKDYKWNEPQLSSIKSNELIMKLDKIT